MALQAQFMQRRPFAERFAEWFADADAGRCVACFSD